MGISLPLSPSLSMSDPHKSCFPSWPLSLLTCTTFLLDALLQLIVNFSFSFLSPEFIQWLLTGLLACLFFPLHCIIHFIEHAHLAVRALAYTSSNIGFCLKEYNRYLEMLVEWMNGYILASDTPSEMHVQGLAQ